MVYIPIRHNGEPDVTRKPTDLVQLKLRFDERLRRRIESAAERNECSMNAEIIKRLEQSFKQVDEIEKIFGGMLVGVLGMEEAKAGSRWSDPGNVKVRGEIAQAIAELLARKVPGLHSVHIATLGEDGRHIGGGSIGYANDEIAKGGLAEILEWAYANSSQSTNSQRAGSK
jgi:Arc-like DNA binding domain